MHRGAAVLARAVPRPACRTARAHRQQCSGGSEAVEAFSGQREEYMRADAAQMEETLGLAAAARTCARSLDPRLMHSNLRWRTSKLRRDPDFFNRMKDGQSPQYLWIGCADSRVPQNEIIGADAGDIFVHRNIANIVLGTDFNCMSVVQYAVTVLKVPHIIVCGHYDCGGARAAMSRDNTLEPPLDNWLRNIRDVYRIHKDELDAIADDEARHRRLVELNVQESCLNLFKTRAVQTRRIITHKEGKEFAEPRIHACVYEHTTGVLHELRIDWKEYLRSHSHIYQLFDKDEFPDGDAAPAS